MLNNAALVSLLPLSPFVILLRGRELKGLSLLLLGCCGSGIDDCAACHVGGLQRLTSDHNTGNWRVQGICDINHFMQDRQLFKELQILKISYQAPKWHNSDQMISRFCKHFTNESSKNYFDECWFPHSMNVSLSNIYAILPTYHIYYLIPKPCDGCSGCEWVNRMRCHDPYRWLLLS